MGFIEDCLTLGLGSIQAHLNALNWFRISRPVQPSNSGCQMGLVCAAQSRQQYDLYIPQNRALPSSLVFDIQGCILQLPI